MFATEEHKDSEDSVTMSKYECLLIFIEILTL